MKTAGSKHESRASFTLLEILISSAIMALAGGSIYLALTSNLNLFAKNTSVNKAHQEILKAVEFITKDVHAAIATPELLNADLSTNAGTGPAAGIALQLMWGRPFRMTTGATGGTSKITIDTNSPTEPRPTAGQRALLPGNDNTEENITLVAANGTNAAYSDITLQNNVWKTISANTGTTYYRPVIITDKVAYVVVNGELHYYTQQYSGGTFSWLDRGVRARGMPSTGAFSTPFSVVNSRTVTGNFSVTDASYSNRSYNTTGMSVTFQVPYRTKLTIY